MATTDSTDAPAVSDTTVENRHPHKTLAVAVGEDTVQLTRTYPVIERNGDGSRVERSQSESIELPIEERQVNHYTEFVVESESFESSASSKSDTERIALAEVGPGGSLEWHDLSEQEGANYLHDDSVWDYELASVPSVRISVSTRSDTHRSYKKRKVRIGREALETVHERDGFLLVVSWREASGASRGTSAWSKFAPLDAVKLTTGDGC